MEKEMKNVKPAEGYTQEEWDDLTDKEKEGVLMGIPEEEGTQGNGNGGTHS